MPLFRSCLRAGQAGGRVRAADGRAADLPHAGEDGAMTLRLGRFAGNILFGRRGRPSRRYLFARLRFRRSYRGGLLLARRSGSTRLRRVPASRRRSAGLAMLALPAAPSFGPARPPYLDHLRLGFGRGNGGTIGRLSDGFERETAGARNRRFEAPRRPYLRLPAPRVAWEKSRLLRRLSRRPATRSRPRQFRHWRGIDGGRCRRRRVRERA